MNRAMWLVGLVALGAMIFFLARTTDDGNDESPPPPSVPSPAPKPAVRAVGLRCPLCEGYGYTMEQTRTGTKTRPCQFCDGKGGKVLQIPPGNVRCPDCQGFGKVETARRYTVCPRCAGRGYVRRPFQPTE